MLLAIVIASPSPARSRPYTRGSWHSSKYCDHDSPLRWPNWRSSHYEPARGIFKSLWPFKSYLLNLFYQMWKFEVDTNTSKSLYLYHILILILSSDRIWGLNTIIKLRAKSWQNICWTQKLVFWQISPNYVKIRRKYFSIFYIFFCSKKVGPTLVHTSYSDSEMALPYWWGAFSSVPTVDQLPAYRDSWVLRVYF